MVCDICGRDLQLTELSEDTTVVRCLYCTAVYRLKDTNTVQIFVDDYARVRAAEIRKRADTACRPLEQVPSELYEAATELCNRIAGLRDPLLSPGEVRNLVKPLKTALLRCAPRGNCGNCGAADNYNQTAQLVHCSERENMYEADMSCPDWRKEGSDDTR